MARGSGGGENTRNEEELKERRVTTLNILELKRGL
jgi:hypothetical protein